MDKSAKAKRFEAIDYEATRQKSIVHFIEELYDQNQMVFRTVFLEDNENVDFNDSEKVDSVVFGALAYEVQELSMMAERDSPNFGVISAHDVAVQLGWLDTINDIKPGILRVIGISDLGSDIINAYRSVQGLRPLT